MKTHGVIENDIDVHEICAAQRAGLRNKLAVSGAPFYATSNSFEDFLNGAKLISSIVKTVRSFLATNAISSCSKAGLARDSRYREGLTALIDISPARLELRLRKSSNSCSNNEQQFVRMAAAVPTWGCVACGHVRTLMAASFAIAIIGAADCGRRSADFRARSSRSR